MTDTVHAPTQLDALIPADDPDRKLTSAQPDDLSLRRVAVAGSVYTILVAGQETNGHYCLIDMFVPPGSGPPLHRHDFEELFTVLEGEIEFTFRGEKRVAAAGTIVSVPANAPHRFTNATDAPARLHCMCTPPGADDFFLETGIPADGRTMLPPMPSSEEIARSRDKSRALAPKYRTEIIS